MKLIITRHGETNWNMLKKVMGRKDISLNENGIKQAFTVKKKLVEEGFELIICSPLLRTKETSNIINNGLNLPIIYDERLIERNFGEFEGLKITDFNSKEFWSYKGNYEYEKAENIRDFFKRVFDFIDDISKKYYDRNILIVTHGGVCLAINCYFQGIPSDDNWENLMVNNCEVIIYENGGLLKKLNK